MHKINPETVVACLRNGFSESQIASSLNVTQSAISQFIQEHGLQSIAAQNSKFETMDSKLNDLEDCILDKLSQTLKYTVLPPMHLAKIYQTVNSAKRRSMNDGAVIHNHNNVNLVQLNLPTHVKVKVGINSRNEVIDIEGRAITSLPSGKLAELNKEKAGDFNLSKILDSSSVEAI
jgi:predicted transcriptional regulator